MTPFTPQTQNLRILLVEESLFHQRLAARLLEKNGYAVVVASNGKEAIAALEKDSFNLILVQGQMADTDMVELKTFIRKVRNRWETHIPIVGMTTDAECRKRCLQVGMHICISRPVRQPELFLAIECVFTQVDFGKSLAQVGGDMELQQEITGVFLTDVARAMPRIQEAIALGNALELTRGAHALKDCCWMVGGGAACEAARRLEMSALEGDLTHAEEAYAALADCIAPLIFAVTNFL